MESPRACAPNSRIYVLRLATAFPHSIGADFEFSDPGPLIAKQQPALVDDFSTVALPRPSTFSWRAATSISFYSERVAFILEEGQVPHFTCSTQDGTRDSLSVPFDVSSDVSVAIAYAPELLGGRTGSVPVAPPPAVTDRTNGSLLSDTSQYIRWFAMSVPTVKKVGISRPMRDVEFSRSWISSPRQAIFLSAVYTVPYAVIALLRIDLPFAPGADLHAALLLQTVVFSGSGRASNAIATCLRTYFTPSCIFTR